MKFLYIMDGTAEGCDYTLGCNLRYETVEAASREEALSKILEEEQESFKYYNDDYGLEKIMIFQIADEFEIDVEKIVEGIKLKEAEEAQRQEEAEILKRAEEIKARNNY